MFMRQMRIIPLVTLVLLVLAFQVGLAKDTLFVMIPHTEGQNEYIWFSRVLERYKASHPDVEVRFEPVVGTGLAAKLTIYLATGDIPDVVMMMQRDLGSMITSDLLVDLNTFLDKDGLKRRDFVGAFLDYWSRDGKQLAMPINPDTGVLYYDFDMFAAAGLAKLRDTYPNGQWTWEDFRRTAQKLTKDTNGDGKTDVYGYQGSWVWEPVWGSVVYSNGGYIYDAKTKQSGLDEPAAYEALQWLADLKRDGLMLPATIGNADMTDRAMQSNAAHLAATAANLNVNLGLFLHPAPKQGQNAVHVILGPGLLLFKSQNDPSLGWGLIQEAMSHESMVSLSDTTARLPARLSAFPTWRSSFETKVSDGQYMMQAVETGKGMPYNALWSDMGQILRSGVTQLFQNVKSAQEIYTNVARSIEALVQ
jgi:multiple sugar transport system substrate-binding protein